MQPSTALYAATIVLLVGAAFFAVRLIFFKDYKSGYIASALVTLDVVGAVIVSFVETGEPPSPLMQSMFPIATLLVLLSHRQKRRHHSK